MKFVTFIILFLVLGFVGLCLRPVPPVTIENAIVQKGVVRNISEGGVKDVVFHLVDDDRVFYINRGLENGFILDDLQKQFKNKEITIVYAEHWTPLDWNNKGIHIARLELGDIVFYDEIEPSFKSSFSYSN